MSAEADTNAQAISTWEEPVVGVPLDSEDALIVDAEIYDEANVDYQGFWAQQAANLELEARVQVGVGQVPGQGGQGRELLRRQRIRPAARRGPGGRRFGGSVELLELPGGPGLQPDEVLIDVRACGVGNWDEFARTGDWDLGTRPPMALGVEAAGLVAAVGDQVAGLSRATG